MEYVYIAAAAIVVGGFLGYKFGRSVEAKAQAALQKFSSKL